MAFLQSCTNQKSEISKAKTTELMGKTIYDFKVESLDGKEINFADFKGKKILIVNTASECGFTPQYADLEKVYEQYKDKLVVVGFPANNFGGQEPGTNTEIGAFCQKNYGVTFPMAAKVSVKGDDTAPIFKFLTEKELNGVKNTSILWNFTKFLVDENGKLIDTFVSTTNPTDVAITKYLK
ncbi:glutathione peroxidase [Chryseobacterium sp. KCF3-3]